MYAVTPVTANYLPNLPNSLELSIFAHRLVYK